MSLTVPATTFLNQIFYKTIRFGPSNLHRLQKFMYSNETRERMQKTQYYSTKHENPIHLEKDLTLNPEPDASHLKYTSTIYFPQIQTSLFWTLYIRKHEYKEYVYIKNHANVEMEEKQKILDYFRKNTTQLKETNHKITNIVIQEILSELMTSPKVTFQTLIAYCVFYKMRIYIVKNNLYLLYDPFYHVNVDDVDTAIIHCNEREQYGIDLDIEKYPEKIEEIKRTKFCIENVDKPLKGVSSYKVSDLQEISNKLGISDDTKRSKQDLYNKIIETCISIGWKK
jgi:hypothetical protein